MLTLIVFLLNGSIHASEHPCKEIASACKAAGFEKGKAKDGKGLIKNCMKPIMSGEAVAGVTVSADQVAACKEKRANRKERRAKDAE